MQNEDYFSKVKSRTKNIFEHASILGTLRSPSTILEAYDDIMNPGKNSNLLYNRNKTKVL
jgi:hypothetical protein